MESLAVPRQQGSRCPRDALERRGRLWVVRRGRPCDGRGRAAREEYCGKDRRPSLHHRAGDNAAARKFHTESVGDGFAPLIDSIAVLSNQARVPCSLIKPSLEAKRIRLEGITILDADGATGNHRTKGMPFGAA